MKTRKKKTENKKIKNKKNEINKCVTKKEWNECEENECNHVNKSNNNLLYWNLNLLFSQFYFLFFLSSFHHFIVFLWFKSWFIITHIYHQDVMYKLFKKTV